MKLWCVTYLTFTFSFNDTIKKKKEVLLMIAFIIILSILYIPLAVLIELVKKYN